MRGTGLIPLTALFVLAKLTGIIDYSWFHVFFPMYVWLLVNFVLWAIVMFRMNRARGRFTYPRVQR